MHTFNAWNEGGPHWEGGPLGPAITFSKDRRLGNDLIYLAKAKGGKWEKLTDYMGATPEGAEPVAAGDKAAGTTPAGAQKEPAPAVEKKQAAPGTEKKSPATPAAEKKSPAATPAPAKEGAGATP